MGMIVSPKSLVGALRLPGSGFDRSGQGTVELAAVLPVVLIIAVIAVNACTFFSECALFDREARQAVRVYATSRAYDSDPSEATAQISQVLDEQFDKDNEEVSVSFTNAGDGCVCYTAEISFAPTLFSQGLKSSVFGVALPTLHHRASLTVDPYDPGVSFE